MEQACHLLHVSNTHHMTQPQPLPPLQTHGARTPQTRFLLARCASDLRKDAVAEAELRGPGAEVRKEVRLEGMELQFGGRAAFALQILSSLL